jgi:hypothetical protein
MNLLITADLVETDSEYNINADFPGVENLDISMQDIFLTSQDRSYGKIFLPVNADMDHGVAMFRKFPKILAGTAIKKLIVSMRSRLREFQENPS